MNIPIRNIWWLMLYASDIGKSHETSLLGSEELPEEIPELIGEILSKAVEDRIRRQLTISFQRRSAVINRVRGRIDHLKTNRKQLLSKGKVACHFDELSINTPRNRYIRTALQKLSRIISKPSISKRCSYLANTLISQGVIGEAPNTKQLNIERFGRHDQADKSMIAAAKLAMDLAIPVEEDGPYSVLDPQRLDNWLTTLFEKAIGGFYRYHLNPINWKVKTGKPLRWAKNKATKGIEDVFPSMKTDIVIDHVFKPHRIVIDTKFTSVFRKGWYREKTLKTEYIYQMYSYLRSQEGQGDQSDEKSAGILLHPAIGESIDESVFIQGHQMRFSTVDLTKSHKEIKESLLALIMSTQFEDTLVN